MGSIREAMAYRVKYRLADTKRAKRKVHLEMLCIQEWNRGGQYPMPQTGKFGHWDIPGWFQLGGVSVHFSCPLRLEFLSLPCRLESPCRLECHRIQVGARISATEACFRKGVLHGACLIISRASPCRKPGARGHAGNLDLDHFEVS